MPVNGLSVGRDVSLDVITSNGTLSIPTLTKFSSKQVTQDTKVSPINGNGPINVSIPDGWEGDFEIERSGSTVDAYFAQLEAAYYAGQNIQAGTITETIENPDNSISQFQYTGVTLKYENAGDWSGNKTVNAKVSFKASTRIQLS